MNRCVYSVILSRAEPDPDPAWVRNTTCSVCVGVLQIEQVSQLAALVQAQLEYHSRSAQILQQLSSKMEDRYGSTCGNGEPTEKDGG